MISSDGNAYIHWTFHADNRGCGTFGASVHRIGPSGPVEVPGDGHTHGSEDG